MQNNKGFTLVEVLIVLAIIGIFLLVGVPYLGRTLSSVKLKATEIELQTIRSILNTYYSEYHKYPPDLQRLVDEKFIGKEILKDGWNTPYIYTTSPDEHNEPNQEYTIISAGKDGIAGTEDDLNISSE